MVTFFLEISLYTSPIIPISDTYPTHKHHVHTLTHILACPSSSSPFLFACQHGFGETSVYFTNYSPATYPPHIQHIITTCTHLHIFSFFVRLPTRHFFFGEISLCTSTPANWVNTHNNTHTHASSVFFLCLPACQL